MSQVANCPTCGSTSKIKEKEGKIMYRAVQKNRSDEKSHGKIQSQGRSFGERA